jgi:hypothetical protein
VLKSGKCFFYPAQVLLEQSSCIDWINVCNVQSLTKKIAFLEPISCRMNGKKQPQQQHVIEDTVEND